MADNPPFLRQYSPEFQGHGDYPSFLPLPALPPRRVLENDYSRAPPPRMQQEVAQQLWDAGPIMGGKGLVDMAHLLHQTYGDVRGHLSEDDPMGALGAAAGAWPAGLAALPVPGAKRVKPTIGEWPVEAALRFGDQHIFRGETHYDALLKAQQSLGARTVDDMLHTAGDGFITNTGRYVSREEAGALADALNKTRYYANKKGKEGFISEALDAYDPKTGREIANPLDVMGLYEGK